ncbi:PEP-CTERM sorting domain-containing protein [Verrucomicrobiaceae bacterium R5-34]|uniref:PEP-CTERM sorting domain-containing protein n=2 Tax=Oceaniferula flava TaxID=2800421 RepID=A0AAE2SDB1_9BACT|nr:PEP-CTERM sorting domain-containing protein [Verrucomicrobiaceae bacterium R5-34]MBK1855307.1 PEP-CTERM sorting domain-containing protein [Oceaniferula flavus]
MIKNAARALLSGSSDLDQGEPNHTNPNQTMMKKHLAYSISSLCMAATPLAYAATPMISTTDFVVAIDADGNGSIGLWGNELSFLTDGIENNKAIWGGASNSGFIVTPTLASGLVASFDIRSADHGPRDVTSWAIYGTNDAITSTSNSTGTDENWTFIDSGTLADPAPWTTTSVAVDASEAYTSYKVLFPTTVGEDTETAVAEFQLYAVPEPSSAALLGFGGLALILRRRK